MEAYLRTIGAVNGGTKGTEHWGKELCADGGCKDFEGGKLLNTFLCKRFVMCYDAEKLIGEGGIEAGTSTMGNKDIVLSLRFGEHAGAAANVDDTAGQAPRPQIRVMVLIKYHAQLRIRNNTVDVAY